MQVKECSRCKKLKNISEFRKEKRGKYGVHSWCKECIAKYMNDRWHRKKVEGNNICKEEGCNKIISPDHEYCKKPMVQKIKYQTKKHKK